jgi:hypothetical protein
VEIRRVLWDGEKQAVGVGWVSPQGADMKIEVLKSGVPSRGSIIRFHAARPETFVECGWQWAPWYPNFEGTDLTAYRTIELRVRAQGPQLPGDLLFSLASPGDHHTTPRVSLKKYAKGLYDGRWHLARIPLKDLYAPEMKFEPKRTIQIILGAWNAKGGDFTVELDDLAVR